jgi:hypothetical protein
MGIGGWHRARAFLNDAATNLALGRSSLGLLGGSSRRLSLRGGGLFGTKGLNPRSLEALGLRGEGFLLCREFGRSLRGLGRHRSLFLGSSLNVGRFPTPTNGVGGCGHELRNRLRHGGHSASPTCGRRGSRLLFGTDTLLTFPASANASDLVVGEHAHVATNGNVHLPKKRDHFFG